MNDKDEWRKQRNYELMWQMGRPDDFIVKRPKTTKEHRIVRAFVGWQFFVFGCCAVLFSLLFVARSFPNLTDVLISIVAFVLFISLVVLVISALATPAFLLFGQHFLDSRAKARFGAFQAFLAGLSSLIILVAALGVAQALLDL